MLTGYIAIPALLTAAWLCSSSRATIRWGVVVRAFALQVLIALVVLRMPWGREALEVLGRGIDALLGCARVGVNLLFGDLAAASVRNSIVLFVLPTIIFFSALVSILYHLGWMQMLIRVVGGAIARLVGVDRIEAMVAAANIFLGQTESPLVVRPYLSGLSRSQVFAVMTSGMAGVAGTVLAAYAQLGVRLDYLLAASFMSGPAGLLMAKILLPDPVGATVATATEVPPEASQAVHAAHGNLIMAASEGAQTGLKIAAGVGAMLLAFSALVALANLLLGAGGHAIGIDGLTVQNLLGQALAPVMYLFGLSWSEAVAVGGLFGEKLVLNEFVAYVDYVRLHGELSGHAQAVATFALCGFANLGSIAIQMAVLGGISASQRAVVASLGLRALLAASLANLLNAAVAGLLIQ
jgi:CNT family concentrative nucleoside transporter